MVLMITSSRFISLEAALPVKLLVFVRFSQNEDKFNVMPEGGVGGWARDEVGTLNALGHPRWGMLANSEHKCWPPGSRSLNSVKTTKANWVLNVGSFYTSVPPS